MRKISMAAGRATHIYQLVRPGLLPRAFLLLLLAFSVLLSSAWAQGQRVLRGKVTGDDGAALQGASIMLKGNPVGTSTDASGNFQISVPAKGGTITVSYVGLTPMEYRITSQTRLDVQLSSVSAAMQDVVVVGYGTQKKATLTGAISSIKGEEIATTKNENVQNMLTGKVPGVRVMQRTAEPGAFNNNFDIRGMGTPLVVIDGIPRSVDDLQRLDPNDIDNLSVLKDASAAIYGVRAANGVVLVTTKKGSSNKVELKYSGSNSWQIPSGLPSTVDALGYMTLRNEAAMHNVNGGTPLFNDQQFDDYRTGKKQSTDWYPLVFSKAAPQSQHNISATGGNDKLNFYAGLGYLYQEGFFKSGDLNYSKYNLRSNITAKLSNRLTFDLNLNGIVDEQDRPYQDSWWIVRGFWRQGPQIPAYANNDPTKLFYGLIEGDNPLAFMDADLIGFKKYNKKWFQGAASLKYDIPGIKGLSAKGVFNYDYYVSSTNLFQKEYNEYRYDEASKTYQKFVRQSPSTIRRESYFKTSTLAQLSLNYNGTFGDHTVSGLLLGERQRRNSDNYFAQRNLLLPLPYIFAGVADQQQATMNSALDGLYDYATNGLVGRFNYAFSGKYLAEFLFRYDGSSRFPGDANWGFFPAGSIGWRISEEPFFKDNSALSVVNNLKIRSSYGKTGDDAGASYQFISGYNYPTSTSARNFTGGYVFDGSFVGSADAKPIPNGNITWYNATTLDIGLDLEMWNGLLGFTGDYFRRNRTGLLVNRTIPTVVGAISAQENVNSDLTYGFDLEVNHRNQLGDFRYSTKGIFSLTRVKRLIVESAPYGSSWDNWKNNQNDRLQGIHSGLQGAGQFQSWEEIWNSPYYIGRGTVPGDYRYEDWNGDGEVNGNDIHPIRYNQVPWMNFSFIFDGSYKGFDLNFLLQGSAKTSLVYGEQLRQPLWGNGESGAMEQFLDRWHPVDPKADPYSPTTQWVPGHFAYTGSLPDENSTFNVEDGGYLRLKSIELGYTVPSRRIGKIGIKNLRVYANAYNLFTITKVRYVDPEHPIDTFGYLYPLNKTVSAGINLTLK